MSKKICLALFICLLFSFNLRAALLLEDGFENGKAGEVPVGWEIVVVSEPNLFEVSDVEDNTGMKSFKITPSKTWDAVTREFTLLPKKQVVTLECYILAESNNSRGITLFLGGNEDPVVGDWPATWTDRAGPYISWQNSGMIQFYDDKWNDIVAYESLDWHRVAVEADASKDTFAFYLDDLTKPAIKNANFRFKVGNFGWMCIASSNAGGAGICYIDDIVIYEGALGTSYAVSSGKETVATVWGRIKR